MPRRSKLSAVLGLKCPRCHEGDLFPTPTFSFKQPFDMKERCDVCNQDFVIEPGFYYGAMFISYIFTGWFCIGFVLFFHWVLDWSTLLSFALLLAVLAVFFVYIFRVARSMWIHLNVKYNPEAGSRKSEI